MRHLKYHCVRQCQDRRGGVEFAYPVGAELVGDHLLGREFLADVGEAPGPHLINCSLATPSERNAPLEYEPGKKYFESSIIITFITNN